MTFAPSNGDRVYANSAAGSFQNFQVQQRRTGLEPTGRRERRRRLAVDVRLVVRARLCRPGAPSRLLVAGLDMRQATDAAQNFSPIGTSMHLDQHIALWDTRGSGTMYAGNDGGLNASVNNGASWTKPANQPWSQYVSLDVSEQQPSPATCPRRRPTTSW